MRGALQQLLGERPRQGRGIELDEVGELGVQHVVDGFAYDGVVPPQGEHTETGQHVQVVIARRVVQVGTLGVRVDLVEADGVQHAWQLRVEVPALQLVALVSAFGEQPEHVERLVAVHPRSTPPAAIREWERDRRARSDDVWPLARCGQY